MANKHIEAKENLRPAIKASHAKAEHAIAFARAACDKAIACRLETAALVEAYSRRAKHTIKAELQGVLTGEEVASHMTISRISKKRQIRRDKRQLTLVGILDRMEKGVATSATVKPSKTVSTIMTRSARELTKKLAQRPVALWSVEERENYLRSVAPYLEIMKEAQK